MSLHDLLLEPLAAGFMQRGLLAAIVIGILSGVIGVYVVTRGMSFLGDALAHSVLPGVAVAFLISGASQSALLIGGLVSGVSSAISIGLLTRGQRVREDTAIGIIFAGTLALGIAIISRSRNFAVDLQHILVGNIYTITDSELTQIILIGIGVLLILALVYKELLVVSFDATLAQTLHLPSETLRLLLLVLLAVTIVVGVQAVGVALIAATLVTPAAAARLLTQRLHRMMAVSAVIAAGCGVLGMYLAWHLRIAPSAAIVLSMTVIFLLVYWLAPERGYLWALLGRSAQRA